MEHNISPTASVQKQTSVPADIIPILNASVWGTPGKTLYRHLQIANRIHDVLNPFFYTLRRAKTVICTMCLAWRTIKCTTDNEISSFYVRYLVANPTFSSKGKRKQKENRGEPKGIIKQFIEEIFASGSAIKTTEKPDSKSMFYAYVESENEQSMHLCDLFGFRPVREMVTVPFSRLSPKAHPHVRRANPKEYPLLREQVASQYRSHSFVCLDHLFYKDNYFVAEHDGHIVAGLQANPTQWAISNLPGISGKILILVLPYIPYVKRLLNPDKFFYSAIEGIFCVEGHEWALDALLETAIEQQGHYSAMMWFDRNCPLYRMLRQHSKLGLIDKINTGGGAEIIVRGNHLDAEDWLWLEQTPAYISCFDLT